MDEINLLAALAQETRLGAFRLLIAHEPLGLAAGELARRLGVPQNTLSSHLNILSQAGLVHATREGRHITYRADVARLDGLIRFLRDDCCGGNPDQCAPRRDP